MSQTLEQLAAQADTMMQEVGAAPGGPDEPMQAAPPVLTNAKAFAGAIGAAREAFCFFTKLESPRQVLRDEVVQELGAVWGPVLDKHGINVAEVMGDYSLEFAAVLATIGIVSELRRVVTAEIAAKAPAKQAEDVTTVEAAADGE